MDTSALVKLVVAERESGALAAAVRDVRLLSSALTVTELRRAVLRRPQAPVQRVEHLLAVLVLAAVDRRVLDLAGRLDPPELRSLDAVHLATALDLGARIAAVVTYDLRLAQAARDAGLAVESPGAA